VFRRDGIAGVDVAAEEVLSALKAGATVEASDCNVHGPLDLVSVGRPVDGHASFRKCIFLGPKVASDRVLTRGSLSWEGCNFDRVAFSGLLPEGPVRFLTSFLGATVVGFVMGRFFPEVKANVLGLAGLPPVTRDGIFVLVLIVAGVVVQALWWMIRHR
jgi:hypothetical protein